MDESTRVERQQSSEVRVDQMRSICLNVANDQQQPANGADLTKIPKRKLSVFYRSFDLIAPIDQTKGRETIEFRRTSSSPSVPIEGTRDAKGAIHEICTKTTGPYEGVFAHNYRSLIESGKSLSSSSPDRLSERFCWSNGHDSATKTMSLSPTSFKLPRVREDTFVDNYATITESTIGKHYMLNNNGIDEFKDTGTSVSVEDSRHDDEIAAEKLMEDDRTDRSALETIDFNRRSDTLTPPTCPLGTNNGLVKIKDSAYPRSFVNASGAGRLGKYTSVDAEMSSHEDSSIGSDSEDDSIERTMQQHAVERTLEVAERSAVVPSRPSATFSIGEPSGKPDPDDEERRDAVIRTEEVAEFHSKRAKRQRFFAVRRSLSEGDGERYHRARRHCRCIRQELFDEGERFPAFPSFNDTRLRIMGLSNLEDIDSLYRENLTENELERKYIAFSIGISTDRITLNRRMALSLRQRDQSERNFIDEVQKMQEDIQKLSPLCTDRESIDRVEKVRHRLDTVARCAHGVSCAAETLGAVNQEYRISRAIFIADKYLQILRSRCENLATEIAETKRILLKNNIVIEESTGEVGDDLPKIRYRNGLPSNNRTVMARRRASIATISRPLTSQDVIKEGPRQRNSVSGRVTLRRPSLCSEMQRWENEKLNRTDSSNSVLELRDIFEQTESRRNSVEENNNLLRIDQSNSIDSVNCNVTDNAEAEDRLTNIQNSFLESNVTKTVEKQLKLCIRTAEPLRLPRNFEVWRSILWYMLIFFLGFYAKQIASC